MSAHFLRQDSLMMVGVCLSFAALPVLTRRRWAIRSLQGLLGLGCFIWAATAVELAQQRMYEEKPFVRMACIIGSVAVFTAWSAWLLGRPALLERYR